MRVVIVGGGQVGFALAQALAAKREVVVVDHDPAVADRFEKLDVEFVHGGATSGATLRRAGVDRSDLFVACTGLDEVNIVACGMANQVGSPGGGLKVVRHVLMGALTLRALRRVLRPRAGAVRRGTRELPRRAPPAILSVPIYRKAYWCSARSSRRAARRCSCCRSSTRGRGTGTRSAS
jgi:threonine dehydrogenase-like Zn-dependent dehydrogenase